jgi:hypothetical protein
MNMMLCSDPVTLVKASSLLGIAWAQGYRTTSRNT